MEKYTGEQYWLFPCDKPTGKMRVPHRQCILALKFKALKMKTQRIGSTEKRN